MEYVIALVGLAAVGAAWDGARRAIEASAAKDSASGKLEELSDRLAILEATLSMTKSSLAELKGFIASGTQKRR